MSAYNEKGLEELKSKCEKHGFNPKGAYFCSVEGELK